MKKFILVLIIAAAIGIYFWGKGEDVTVEPTPTPTQGSNFKPNPANATFTFEDEAITLSAGKKVGEEDEISLLNKPEYGDINNDGKLDAVVLLTRSGGGSGVFIHVAAYVSGPVNYKGTNTVFLGDRIAPQNISISNGIIRVNYLDRGANEPFAAEPTVETYKELIYKNGELVEK